MDVGVFLDLSTAFDFIDHAVPLDRLSGMGLLRGAALTVAAFLLG